MDSFMNCAFKVMEIRKKNFTPILANRKRERR